MFNSIHLKVSVPSNGRNRVEDDRGLLSSNGQRTHRMGHIGLSALFYLMLFSVFLVFPKGPVSLIVWWVVGGGGAYFLRRKKNAVIGV